MISINSLLSNLSKEKNLDKKTVVNAMKKALSVIVKKRVGYDADFEAEYNAENDSFDIYQHKTVVETVKNTNREISLTEAQKSDPEIHVDDVVGELVLSTSDDNFTVKRNEFAVVKQVLSQQIKYAEKQNLMDSFSERVGKMVVGIVKKIDEKGNVFVDLGKSDYLAVLYKSQQMPDDYFRVEDRVKAVLMPINSSSNEIRLSRTSHLFALKVLEEEISAIEDGIVEVVRIAREPGVRTKVVVRNTESQVDPVGICIGENSFRINAVRDTLNGEKVNLINDTSENDFDSFLENVVKPGDFEVYVSDENEIDLVSSDESIGKLIGTKGSNIKLIASILGKKVNVISQTKLKQKLDNAEEELMQVDGMTQVLTRQLFNNKVYSVKELAETDLTTVDDTDLTELKENAKKMVKEDSYTVAEEIKLVESYGLPRTFTLPDKKSNVSVLSAEQRLREELKSYKMS